VVAAGEAVVLAHVPVRAAPAPVQVAVVDRRDINMNSLKGPIQRWFSPVEPLEPGIYHYQAPAEDPRNYRLHLRLEKAGTGILIINASTILHLNQTAAELAYHLVQGKSEDEAATTIASRYRISFNQAKQDYADLIERIDTLVTTQDLDPVTDLEFSRQRPYTGPIFAPYRLDCALTYRLSPNVSPDAAPIHRVKTELSTLDWKNIFDIAWTRGIPHLIFTGGEPTLRDDLIDLINHAENSGQVTGLLTDGIKLMEEKFRSDLLQTGLDHLLIVPPLEMPSIWDTLSKIASADIYSTIHITLSSNNQDRVPGYLQQIAELGFRSLSLSTSDENLNETLISTRELATGFGLTLVWDLPVPYSSQNPFEFEFVGQDRPSGAGKAWLYIEPDGDVLPDQSVDQVLGNILNDPWELIWHPEILQQ
jgi:hypothetical protein